MKVFFPLGAFYPSQIGGPCNTLFWHTCALKRKGVNVDIVTTTTGIDSGIVTENTELAEDCGTVFYGSSQFFGLRRLKKAFNKIGKADIVHLNSLFTPLSIACFFYVQIFFPKKRIVWSVRGELDNNALSFSGWKKRPLMMLYRRTTRNIVFHSTSISETNNIKVSFPTSNVVQIPNLIKPFRRLNLPVEKQLLFLGRIHPIKAIEKLIEALPLSRMFGEKGFKLIIVGKHESRHQYYMDELLKLIKELKLDGKVLFLGHTVNMKKEELLSKSHALILPSRTENFGNVVVEALHQGTPVIASQNTPWSILQSYQCGFHIDNSPKEIAKHIDKIINLDPKVYLQYRLNSQKLIDDKYSVDTQIGKWISVYRRILC